ncbi:MAG: FkbM family methyltransferase [Proteobacteria bacterium]|nr:FkbM family methyltransferase [Pseudomonadota bacterium]MBU1649808.1 FkbM family methyltransferase [Pseudomonadota bacterium]
MDGKGLQKALYILGRNEHLRKQLIEFLKNAENNLEFNGSIRDEITGPIVDALHDEKDVYEKSLSDGTRFKFLFRTKIARDFLMAPREHPSHVWEPQTTKLLLALTSSINGDVIVGGAYFGDQAVLVAKNIRSSGRSIHCFEPNLDQARMLKENFLINNLDNVRINTLGLWSESSVRLKLDGFDSFANAVKADIDEEGFETVSIDDYRNQFNLEIGLIQLDIEGAELGTLRGASKTITQFKPHIVFEVHKDYVDWTHGLENTEICRLLFKAGYNIFAIRDFNSHYEMPGKPVELIPADKVYLEGPPHGFNMVAVRDAAIFSGSGYKIVENVSPKLLLHKNPTLHHPTDGL